MPHRFVLIYFKDNKQFNCFPRESKRAIKFYCTEDCAGPSSADKSVYRFDGTLKVKGYVRRVK